MRTMLTTRVIDPVEAGGLFRARVKPQTDCIVTRDSVLAVVAYQF